MSQPNTKIRPYKPAPTGQNLKDFINNVINDTPGLPFQATLAATGVDPSSTREEFIYQLYDDWVYVSNGPPEQVQCALNELIKKYQYAWEITNKCENEAQINAKFNQIEIYLKAQYGI